MGLNREVPEKNMDYPASNAQYQLPRHGTTKQGPKTGRTLPREKNAICPFAMQVRRRHTATLRQTYAQVRAQAGTDDLDRRFGRTIWTDDLDGQFERLAS